MRVESEIKKWGNSLALRITGVMADLPNFTEGDKVLIDVSEEGLLIKPANPSQLIKLPFSEAELLEGLTVYHAHADELALPIQKELGDQ